MLIEEILPWFSGTAWQIGFLVTLFFYMLGWTLGLLFDLWRKS